MTIDIDRFMENLLQVICKAFQISGPDGFQLGIGWILMVAVGVALVVLIIKRKIKP
jgi:hypothetical protein